MYPLHCVQTGPLLQTCCAPKRYTAGHWSLTRPGVFYIGREDGYVDIWDLLEKTHEPAQSQNICITMITYIKPWTFSSMFILIHGATCLEKLGMLGCSPEKALPPPGFPPTGPAFSSPCFPLFPQNTPLFLSIFAPGLWEPQSVPRYFGLLSRDFSDTGPTEANFEPKMGSIRWSWQSTRERS